MSDGNKLYLENMPESLRKAQEACLQIYLKLVASETPPQWPRAVAYLHGDPMFSLLLTGPDCLLKSALLSAIQAYVSLGDKIAGKGLTRLNVSVPINLLSEVPGLDKSKLERYYAEGHTKVVVVTKQFPD